MKTGPQLTSTESDHGLIVKPQGVWRLAELKPLDQLKSKQLSGQVTINGSELKEMDTAGASLLLKSIAPAGTQLPEIRYDQIDERARNIIELVRTRRADLKPKAPRETLSFLARLGRVVIESAAEVGKMISFGGEVLMKTFNLLLKPALIRTKELVVQIEQSGLNAIPIVALVMYLIGIVVAYLFASQSVKYGAGIFIVETVGMGMTRELAPIIAAIVVAGRSGSAFTAQLGTMKINQEVDAITTLGLSAMNVLVIPRVLATIITLPLLVFIGDIVGILGGMTIAHYSLDITPASFIDRLRLTLPLKFVWVGLGKAPVFALVISLIGCYRGLSVEDNARSVGLNTTATVVQSIVAVILLDAAFAILFQELGI